MLNRLAVYHQKTAPLIDHYREAGLLKNIGGGLSLEEISEEVFRTLEATMIYLKTHSSLI